MTFSYSIAAGGSIHIVSRRGAFRIVEQLPQLREHVGAVAVVQLGDEREMVDASDDRVERAHVGVEEQAHHELHADELVAQTDRLHLRLARHRAAQRGERVRHVHEERVRADGFDVARDVEDDGNAAQRAHHASGSDGVTDRLAHPVALGDLEVVRHALEATDRQARDDVIGAFEGPLAIGLGGHRQPDVASAREGVAQLDHSRQLGCVDVVEHDSRVLERRRVREIGQHPGRPVVAPAADDRDSRCGLHGRPPVVARRVGVRDQSRPRRRASAAASPRFATPSLVRMLETWTLAVLALMNNVSAT